MLINIFICYKYCDLSSMECHFVNAKCSNYHSICLFLDIKLPCKRFFLIYYEEMTIKK